MVARSTLVDKELLVQNTSSASRTIIYVFLKAYFAEPKWKFELLSKKIIQASKSSFSNSRLSGGKRMGPNFAFSLTV